jgi:hypothetical protein
VSPPNSSRAADATAHAALVRLIYCLLLIQDASYAQFDTDKLQAVQGVRKHSVYKDSDGTLW